MHAAARCRARIGSGADFSRQKTGSLVRVLHLVSASTLTGPADPALGLARTLRSCLGIDLALACDRFRQGNMVEKVTKSGVPLVEDLSVSTKSSPFSILGARRRLRTLADEFDVIHAHTSHDHALACAARGRARLVRTIHHPRNLRRRVFQSLAYGRTDGLVLVAEEHRRTLMEEYRGLDPERITVIRGAVDTERFSPEIDGSGLRTEYAIPPSAFVIGMIARIKPGRGHALLLHAFQAALKRLGSPHDLRLAFIGKGEGEGSLKDAIAARGLGSRISFYGFRDEDLPVAIRSCDVTVLLKEGSDAGCRAVLESLASGVPVVGAECPAIREALCFAGAPSGVLIPSEDGKALEDALVLAAGLRPNEIAQWGARARSLAIEAYSEIRRASETRAFYERLLASEPVGS